VPALCVQRTAERPQRSSATAARGGNSLVVLYQNATGQGVDEQKEREELLFYYLVIYMSHM